MHFFFFCLPNSDLPCDKTESSLPPGENRNGKMVERALGAWVAWQPGCKLRATIEMHLLDPGQGFFPFLTDIFLSSAQPQSGWSFKNFGVAFAFWDLWSQRKGGGKSSVFSLNFSYIFDGSFIVFSTTRTRAKTKQHE